MTIVEINPGYLPTHSRAALYCRQSPHQPKGAYCDRRRPQMACRASRIASFDFILMNTSFNWRANTSNLLSVKFLQLVRQHLKPGGVEFYNTTDSEEVQLTGATVFPYALRVANFLAVSDSPIVFDRAGLRSTLGSYRIDGQPVFDFSRSSDRAKLEQIASMSESTEFRPQSGT